MILFVQNLCSATRELLKCTMRYSSSFEFDDLRGLVKLAFASPLDMLPAVRCLSSVCAVAYHSAPLSSAELGQQLAAGTPLKNSRPIV